MKNKQCDRILRKPELISRLGLSDVTIWRLEKSGDFPKRIQLGGNSVGWLESEIVNWIQERAEQRN
jgi:prophage regulatory protein